MTTIEEKPFLKVKDFSVSQETFNLYYNSELDMLETSPKPDLNNLGRYYESDDYISHTDNKRSVFERCYHFVKNIALNKKVSLINHYQPNKGKLLDIGAGTGDFLVRAQKDGWLTIGIEPSDKARANAKLKGIHFVAKSEDLENNSFDVITMWHVLEHVPDLHKQITELKRLLKPSGTLIIAVPNFKSFDASYYKEYWAAYDVPIHFWHFSKTAIQKIFQPKQFSLQAVLPMKFDSFYVSLLSEKYKTGRMNFIKATFIGGLSNLKAVRSKEYSSHIYVLENQQLTSN